MMQWIFVVRVAYQSNPLFSAGLALDHLFWYESDDAPFVPSTLNLAANWWTAIAPVIKPMMPSQSYVPIVYCSYEYGTTPIGGTGSSYLGNFSTDRGTSTAPLLPLQDVISFQRRDAIGSGRSHRGRFVWPIGTAEFHTGWPACIVDNGNANVIALANLLKTTQTLNGKTWTPVIKHRAGGLRFTPVVETDISLQLCMRRRNRPHVAVWTPAPP